MTTLAARHEPHRLWTLLGDYRWQLGVAVALSALPFAVGILQPHVRFSPDSWSYYDLAQTVFGDFYHPAVTRSYHEVGGYSQSFPLLWPVLIAGAGLGGIGPGTQVVLASLLAVLTIVPLYSIARAVVGHRLPALVVATVTWVCLAGFEGYRDEVVGGRAIPLAILLLTSAIAVLVRGSADQRLGSCVAGGILLGASCLARFDSLPLALVLVLVFACRPRVRWLCRLGLLASFVVALSPWVIYSETHYGTAWASDNSFVALSAEPTFVMNYSTPTQTIRTHPARWLKRVVKNSVHVAFNLLGTLVIFPLALASIVGALAIGLWHGLAKAWPGRATASERPMTRLLGVVFAACCGLAGQALTGYYDARYFALICTIGTLSAIAFVIQWSSARRLVTNAAIGCAVVVALCSGWLGFESRGASSTATISGAGIAALRREAGATILDYTDSCFAAGALTRVHVVCAPQDWDRLSQADRQRLLQDFHITRVRAASSPNAEPSILPVDYALIGRGPLP